MEMFINTPIAFFLQEAVRQQMTIGGWAFMAGAWIFILVLTFYTFSKVLFGKK
jgi:hypothetical protein